MAPRKTKQRVSPLPRLRRYPRQWPAVSRAALFAACALTAVGAVGDAVGLDIATKLERQRIPIVPGSGQTFSDCAAGEPCPSMTVVPAATAVVGSPATEGSRQNDEMQRTVTFAAFAIGTTEVTVAEYQLCVREGGCAPPEWLEPGGQHNIETGTSRYYKNLGALLTGAEQPIVGVSHQDATAYAAWLARRTGQAYRLPSEAEWEYAARAGSQTAYWWGDDVREGNATHANCRGCGSDWDARGAAPVRSFAANAWGLHEVHGNVWEWVADIYCAETAGAPNDGRASDGGPCATNTAPSQQGLRVLRGGSSFFEAPLARAAVRLRNRCEFRNFSVGFRVARSLGG